MAKAAIAEFPITVLVRQVRFDAASISIPMPIALLRRRSLASRSLPVLLSLAATPVILAQDRAATPAADDLVARIDGLLDAHHAIDQLSGAVLVADGGEVIYRGARGMANSDWGVPNTPATKFRLASITKQFTAMLVLLLVEEGSLNLDDPLTTWLPEYPAESGAKVTIRHLLNHTSGIPSYTDRPGFLHEQGKVELPVLEFVAKYCSDPLEFEPGSQWRYNNSGYFLLGALVEQVTGKTFRDALRERVLDPLGMADTDLDDEYAVVPGRATGYDDLLGGRRVAMWLDMAVPYSAGGLYSTVDDLWQWDRALRAGRLLGEELTTEMFTPGLQDYGFGWSIEIPEGSDLQGADTVIQHTGGMPGVSTLIWRQPGRDRCVIVLGNSSGTAHHAIQQGLVALLEGREPPPVRPRGDFEIARRVLADGIEAGLQDLAKWPQQVREEYIERDMNSIGYGLLEQRRFDEAIRVFEFLTVAYPKSANTWDSLGEGHLRAGHVAAAITGYEKALELDPTSATIPPILEELRRR